jgi:hypothetical protein
MILVGLAPPLGNSAICIMPHPAQSLLQLIHNRQLLKPSKPTSPKNQDLVTLKMAKIKYKIVPHHGQSQTQRPCCNEVLSRLTAVLVLASF